MADSTLDDLILTETEPEKGKSKGLLALLALIVLLIIVGAILAKMIFSSSENNATDANNSKEPTVQTTVDNNEQNSNTAQDNNTAAANAEIQDPDLAPLDDMNNTMDATLQADSIDGGVVEDGAPAATKVKNTQQESKEKDKKTEKAVEKPTQTVSKQNSHTVDKQEYKKQVVHKVTTPHKTHKTYGGSGTVYIQVGSFVKGPESGFIEKIRRAGFKFRIKEKNGNRRVYVGPFRSRQEASSLLGKVKAEINPNAFIK